MRLREEPAFTAALPRERATTVTVRWRDGSSGSATVRNARGNPDDPLTPDEVATKFRRNAQDVLTPATSDAVVAALLGAGDGRTLADVAGEVLGRLTP